MSTVERSIASALVVVLLLLSGCTPPPAATPVDVDLTVTGAMNLYHLPAAPIEMGLWERFMTTRCSRYNRVVRKELVEWLVDPNVVRVVTYKQRGCGAGMLWAADVYVANKDKE